MNTLLVRTDASSSIGIGHAMRCIALAESWAERGGNVTFAATTLSPLVEVLIQSAGYSMVKINATPGSQNDVKQLVAIRETLQPNWIVMDGYCFHENYQRQLASPGYRTLVIDDHGTIGRYAADIVLDQNLGANASIYENKGCHAQFLMGSHYALLRREFRAAAKEKRNVASVARRILVTLGGGDPDNVMAKVVRALAMVPAQGLSILLVMGADHPHQRVIEKLATELPHETKLIASTDRMNNLISWADVAITGGGSTCWELALLQLPSLILILAENQRPIAEELSTRGFAINLGWHGNVIEAELAAQLTALLSDFERRRQVAAAGQKIVDGQGAVRVVDAMLN